MRCAQKIFAGANHHERADDIDLVQSQEIIFVEPRQIGMVRDLFGDTGVVHENIETTIGVRDFGEFPTIGVFCHIGLNTVYLCTKRPALICSFLCFCCAARIIDHHGGACFGQPESNTGAEAGCRAGDDCHAS